MEQMQRMAKNTLSRVTAMNYTYKLNISQNEFNVIEFRHYSNGEIAETVWAVWYFLANLYLAELNDGSFFRTKKWLVSNHPELLL